MSRQPDSECPDRFEENHGCLPNFTIPNSEGIMRQAHYIKLGNGPVPFALGTLGQEGDPVFQYNLFAAPSYIRDSPTEPLPMWLIDTISGKSSSYHQAMDLARSTDDWGLAAKIARYHEADTRILNIVAEIHALNCKLQVVKAASRGLVLSNGSEPFRLSTCVAPPALMHTPRVSTLPVVGRRS